MKRSPPFGFAVCLEREREREIWECEVHVECLIGLVRELCYMSGM